MLYTDISSDLQIYFKPTLQQNELINKQIKTRDVVWTMAYNKMSKTHHCAGRLLAAIWLKCKNEFTIKKSFLQPIMNFPPKVFQSWFNPRHGYKTVNKSSQKSVNSGDCEQREPSRVTFWTRSKTADALPIHITFNTSDY